MKFSIGSAARWVTGVLIAIASVQSPLHALVNPQVPEIDGASMSAGLGLLAAGILLIRSRRHSKRSGR